VNISPPTTYILKLNNNDFDKAKKIIEENIEINLDEIDPEYSLLKFNQDELLDVLKNKTEWGDFNYKLAITLLRKKGMAVSDTYLN
jgi:uncharacterized protein YfbU (UPF0304 family)